MIKVSGIVCFCKMSALRTIPVHDEREGLIREAVSAGCVTSNVIHEFWSCGGGRALESNRYG